MTPRERILAIRLIEKAKKYPEYAKKIKIKVNQKEKNQNG